MIEAKAPFGCIVFEHCLSLGSRVSQGQDVLVVEAMKMTYPIESPANGIVTWMRPPGESAEAGDTIAVIQEDPQ